MAMTFSAGTSARILWTCWEDETSAAGEDRNLLADVRRISSGVACGENESSVAAAAPEGEAIAEIGLESARLHAAQESAPG